MFSRLPAAPEDEPERGGAVPRAAPLVPDDLRHARALPHASDPARVWRLVRRHAHRLRHLGGAGAARRPRRRRRPLARRLPARRPRCRHERRVGAHADGVDGERHRADEQRRRRRVRARRREPVLVCVESWACAKGWSWGRLPSESRSNVQS